MKHSRWLPSSPSRQLAFAVATLLLTVAARAADAIDLSGKWRFALDASNRGISERWQGRDLTGAIALPGSVQQARIGDPVTPSTSWTGSIVNRAYFTAPEYERYRQPGNVKVPFWLQPETHYAGAVWYQREVEIPSVWQGRRVFVFLERPHWKATVWLDERELGSADSLAAGHRFELGAGAAPGRHRLTLRIDNTFDPDIGENSHSMSDHTQGNWNGVVGRIELGATAPVWMDDLQVYPNLATRTMLVKGRVARLGELPLPAEVELVSTATKGGAKARVQPDGQFSITLPLKNDAALWDEFNPALQRLTAKLPGENGDVRELTFGLRDFHPVGRQLTINGRPVFLRGTLDCAAYPRTGHPPTDAATWRTILSAVKSHGLNHVRFHSWCPPEAAFAMADELGVYLQVEVCSWPNQSTTLGDGKPVDAWLKRETTEILRAYGNHPSFVMLAAGNEPGGQHFSAWLSDWLMETKKSDPRRIYTSASGWPELAENDYHVTPEPRIQHWGEGLNSRINRFPPETRTDYGDFIRERTVPVVSHEIGQWCVYPNFAEMPKYTGYLKPKNFEIFRETLAEHGMADQAQAFLQASGKLQTLCYKEDIESALRTPEMGGFQLLGLSDFPGQGTALVGVLDTFWEGKGYVTAAEFARFCGPTVPLVRLDKRVFTADEHLVGDAEVAHFGPSALEAQAGWELRNDGGQVVARGTFGSRHIGVGERNGLGRIDLALGGLPAPARYKLSVSLIPSAAGESHETSAAKTPAAKTAGWENDWDIWVYPSPEKVSLRPSENVLLAKTLDSAALARLEQGGAVVLMLSPGAVASDKARGPIALGFSSIFWNTNWTNGQAPHTLGILCDPKHPALASFPTDGWSNWQWWYPVSHAAPMILDGLPKRLVPIVQVIDDWVTNRKLALVFEAKCGRGRLLVTSIDLEASVLDPVRRQLRSSLLAYAASDSFRPSVELAPEEVRSLVSP
ncbi:hypothetical protein DB347_19530 [Opitutaceae bacterium EW11]|nr:hypothetical protein DB347_19530 [Opitutaceae bacterium EW11]